MKAVPINRYLTFVLLALSGCAADLASKHWVFNYLGMPQNGVRNVRWVWEPYFGLETSTNEGALFGLGHGHVWIFAGASIVAIAGISYWLFLLGAARDWLLTVALGLVMGGVLGNLYDRLGLWSVPGLPDLRLHAVRDWILCQCPPWVWPNFNIADSLLVCGGALFAWHSLTQVSRDKHSEAESAAEEA